MTNNNKQQTSEWLMILYALPFNLMMYHKDKYQVHSINYKGAQTIIYPPYRSKPLNYSPSGHPINTIYRDGELKPVNDKYILPKSAMYFIPNKKGEMIIFSTQKANWSEEWSKTEAFPADTIRVDKNLSNSPENEYNILTDLMDILRVKSGQWWINKNFTLNGHEAVRQKILPNGVPTEEAPDCFTPPAKFTYSKAKIIDNETWKSALDDLEREVLPPFHKQLLLDVFYHSTVSDSRRLILDLASSLDMAVDFHFQRLWVKRRMGTFGNYSRKAFIKCAQPKPGDRYISVTKIPLLVSHCTSQIVGRSFKFDHPTDYEILTNFWKTKRNTVSHGSLVDFEDGEERKTVVSVKSCLEWLESLR